MNEYRNFTEYVVRPETTSSSRLLKIILICAYTIFAAVYLWIFWLNFRALALLIMLPFLMYAIVKVTWRFTSVEYEYAIEAGELTVSVIYSGTSRRVKCRAYLPEATLIAPYDRDSKLMLEKRDISDVKCYIAAEDSDSAYVCVCPDKKRGRNCAVIFETNTEMQRIMRICNPTAFTSRH